MKISRILTPLLLLLSISATAQLDLEHWFPPIHQSAVGTMRATDMRVYLSTDKKEKVHVILYINKVKKREYYLDKDHPLIADVSDLPLLARP